MMPNIVRGGRMAGLMVYLAGPGRQNEHELPRLVAGHDVVTFTVDPGRELSRDDALDIANALDQPRRVHGTSITKPVKEFDEDAGRKVEVGRTDAHVWHCSLSLRTDEGVLSDSQWQSISEDFVKEMGFMDPDGAKSSRWAAVRHGLSTGGNDHVHLVVQLVREDGTKARIHNDAKRAQAACNMLEKKYGLAVVESREHDRGTLAGVKPAELDRARVEGRPAVHKDLLRHRIRSAVALSGDEREFISRLRENHVLVRPRFAAGGRDKVEGYSVALEPAAGQKPVWYAPSKLDANLGLGRVRAWWDSESEARAVPSWVVQAGRAGRTTTGAEPMMPRTLPVSAVRRMHRAENGGPVNQKVAADFAAVLSHLSITLERGTPGPLARAADTVARGHQRNVPASTGSTPLGYQARLMDRAVSKDSDVGWKALMQQALRMGRMMEKTTLRQRPQLVAALRSDLRAAAASHPELVAARGAQTATHTTTHTTMPARTSAPVRDDRDLGR